MTGSPSHRQGAIPGVTEGTKNPGTEEESVPGHFEDSNMAVETVRVP